MSFSLGIYDVLSYILPGMIYFYSVNEILKTLGWAHIEYSDLSDITSLFGIVAACYLLGFIFRSLLFKLWFENQPRLEERYNEFIELSPEKYGIEFTYLDIDYLYLILVQRSGDIIRNYVDRLNAYAMMFQNLVGSSISLLFLQVTIMIINGFSLANLLFSLLFILAALYFFRRQEDTLMYWCISTIGHAYAYGNNLAAFLSNDQPKWDYKEIMNLLEDTEVN